MIRSMGLISGYGEEYRTVGVYPDARADFMPFFVGIEIDEDGTIKPEKPLNADQWRRRSKRQTATQQKMRDENARHTSKLRDLQGKFL